jgi:hypothetical protein
VPSGRRVESNPKGPTTDFSILVFAGPSCCIVYRDMLLEESNNCWLNLLDKLMYEIILSLINHHMLILSTAGQRCVRTVTGFVFVECGSDCHAVMDRKFKQSQ